MKHLFTIITLIALTGCAAAREFISKEATPRVAEAIKKYCELPPSERGQFRDELNALLEEDGRSAAIDCGDG